MSKMLANLHNLFRSADDVAKERMAALDLALDNIAKAQTARYSRGNAAIQMGLCEFEEELDLKRETTIARRR
jgi:hypothetical protein